MKLDWLSFTILAAASGSQHPEWMRYAWYWSMPMIYGGACILIYVLYRFVKMFGKAEMCRAGLAESSEVEITEPGKFDLCLVAPAMTFMAGRGLQYELVNAQNGQPVAMYGTAAMLFGRKGVSQMTIPVRSFEIVETGKYLLRVSGHNPQIDYSRYALTITRPITLKIMLYVLALLLSVAMLVSGIVFTSITAGANR